MSNRPKRKNVRQSDFRIVARGVRRPHTDFPRITQAAIQHHLAAQEKAAELADRSHRRRGGRDGSS